VPQNIWSTPQTSWCVDTWPVLWPCSDSITTSSESSSNWKLATCQENQETQLLSHRSQPMTPMLRAVLVSQQLQLDQSNQSGSDSQLQHWRDAPRSARPREGWNRDHSFSHSDFISVVWSPWVILCCNSHSSTRRRSFWADVFLPPRSRRGLWGEPPSMVSSVVRETKVWPSLQ